MVQGVIGDASLGTLVQNAQDDHTYASTWGLSPADAALLAHDVVTPIKPRNFSPRIPQFLDRQPTQHPSWFRDRPPA
jgi:hypothetical protein